MKTTKPVVSVIIPVYNSELYIDACLESVLRQTYTNLQVICVDDGSTDHSNEKLIAFKEKDNRFEIITTFNKGVSSARNTGIDNARGQYVCFLDSDDWLTDEIIEIEVARAIEGNLDLVISGVANVYPRVTVANNPYNCRRDFNEFNINVLRQRFVGLNDDELKRPESIDWLSTTHGKLYKRELIEKHEIRFDADLNVGEDTLFNIQYAMLINRACFLPSPLYNFRKSNSRSVTQQYKPHLLATWELLHKKIHDTICVNGQYTNAYDKRVALSIIGLCINEMRMKGSFMDKCRRLRDVMHSGLYDHAYDHLNITKIS